MAGNGKRRVNSRADREMRYAIDGNAVRKTQAIPKESEQKRVRKPPAASRRPRTSMNRLYVLFLAAMSVAAVLMGVKYVELRSQIIAQTKTIASLESSYSKLKANNDAYYNTVMASLDLEYIKEVAMSELDMDYPRADQIYQFDTAGNSYIRQYQDVPQAD